MLRIVVDTSVIVSALRSREGAGNALLRSIALRRVMPLATPALFLEYEEVLKRPEQRLAHGLTLEDLDRFLAGLASACEPIETRFQWRPQLADADDEMVLEAAVNGRADAIVTYNVKDFAAGAARFGIRAVRPGDCMKEMKSWPEHPTR